MMQIQVTNQFKRDYKLAKRRNKNLAALDLIMQKIANLEVLDMRYKDHALTGKWHLHRELHIESDWLLIYRFIPNEQIVVFVRTGTHSDLFND